MAWVKVSEVFSCVDEGRVNASCGVSCPLAVRLGWVYVLLVLVVLMVGAGLLAVLWGIFFLVFVLSRRVGLDLDLSLAEVVLLGVLRCLDGARVRFVGTKLASSELLGSGSAMLNESSSRDWLLSRRSGRRFRS